MMVSAPLTGERLSDPELYSRHTEQAHSSRAHWPISPNLHRLRHYCYTQIFEPSVMTLMKPEEPGCMHPAFYGLPLPSLVIIDV